MLNYKIRYIEYCGRIDDFVFDFDKKLSLLSTFLSSDVTAFEDWIKSDFDKVLSGECATKEFFGNVCGVEITPDTTKVFDNLTDDILYNHESIEQEYMNIVTREVNYDWNKK